jgi:divalent metal cation (Fe/Co/Zn/Cd) transporter
MNIKKMFNKQEESKEQEEAKRRAEGIDNFVAKLIKLAVEADLTVNDFKVVANEVGRRLEMVFNSHKISFYSEQEEKKDVEVK